MVENGLVGRYGVDGYIAEGVTSSLYGCRRLYSLSL